MTSLGQLTINLKHIVKARGPIWKLLKEPLSPSAVGEILIKIRPNVKL